MCIREKLLKLVQQDDVSKYSETEQSSIVYDRSFFDICKTNRCGNYGQCYMCPPNVGDIDELIEKAKANKNAILFQTIHAIEDSFDYEGMVEAAHRHADTMKRIRQALNSDSSLGECLLLGSGTCICDRCAKRDNLPCRFPLLATPSMESYGIFVSETAKNAGLKYINGANTVTYFGIILFN